LQHCNGASDLDGDVPRRRGKTKEEVEQVEVEVERWRRGTREEVVSMSR
jgi:hypothetical protein